MAEKEYIERGALFEAVRDKSMTRCYDENGKWVAFGHCITGKAPIDWSEKVDLEEFEEVLNNIPAADVVEVRHGKWVKHDESKDDFYHHRCSICKEDAPFHYVETEDYDEGMDGEFYFIGMRITNIVEHLTNYCPNCGAKMDGERKEQK